MKETLHIQAKKKSFTKPTKGFCIHLKKLDKKTIDSIGGEEQLLKVLNKELNFYIAIG